MVANPFILVMSLQISSQRARFMNGASKHGTRSPLIQIVHPNLPAQLESVKKQLLIDGFDSKRKCRENRSRIFGLTLKTDMPEGVITKNTNLMRTRLRVSRAMSAWPGGGFGARAPQGEVARWRGWAGPPRAARARAAPAPQSRSWL